MEEQYALWLLLHLFLNLMDENGNKTCRFRTISDSATHSTSCQKFFEIHFHCGESPTLLPFKTLILTAPVKIVNNCLPLQFCWQFSFAYMSLISSENWITKNHTSWKKTSIKFYFQIWAFDNVITNTMVTPCQNKRETWFYVLFISINKIAPRRVQYCRIRVY